MKVRPADSRDAARLAALAGQLGYPSTAVQIVQRLERIAGNEEHAVLVAESEDGLTIGWIHVFVCHLVESDDFTEIGGLVVDEKCRGAGIGQRLVEEAEAWARAKGCTSIRLRSNIIRQEAHQFYLKLGYRVVKTQHAFTKTL